MILKKVSGEVNPTNLQTKFNSVPDKSHQNVQRYVLLFMRGHAKAASLLKKKVNIGPIDDMEPVLSRTWIEMVRLLAPHI